MQPERKKNTERGDMERVKREKKIYFPELAQTIVEPG